MNTSAFTRKTFSVSHLISHIIRIDVILPYDLHQCNTKDYRLQRINVYAASDYQVTSWKQNTEGLTTFGHYAIEMQRDLDSSFFKSSFKKYTSKSDQVYEKTIMQGST